MGSLLGELGKQLAERWMALLVLPGALLVATLTAAWELGHAHALDAARLGDRLDAWAASPRLDSPGGVALVLLAVGLAAAGAGLAAQGLGSAIERAWLTTGTRPRRLTEARRRRWERANDAYEHRREELAQARARGEAPPPGPALGEARAALEAVSAERPERPTWMADRLNAPAVRLDREYDLDLGTVWPHLWLVLPESARLELSAARETLTRSVTLAGWGLLHAAVGALWWPGLLVGAVTVATGWRRARAATATYAQLIEAAARLHAVRLARHHGLPTSARLTRTTGWQLTCLIQGQGHLIPLTDPPGR
ncbi:hypothetical protein [Streptomyces radicis]|uniref:Vegetative cell wall protein gp1 n=1 Tax=Streptomyces radicis TaxID=1750517 RepID=A0A3A9W746_9ACTN|nr:hypothetical protein [Streptomyces radicis]RKN08629.1 hypothetical protein D7319_14645 [Streptomyces radicis]RKN21787.1 hypothetical protein D7318_15600 [Streptomyces radicis]